MLFSTVTKLHRRFLLHKFQQQQKHKNFWLGIWFKSLWNCNWRSIWSHFREAAFTAPATQATKTSRSPSILFSHPDISLEIELYPLCQGGQGCFDIDECTLSEGVSLSSSQIVSTYHLISNQICKFSSSWSHLNHFPPPYLCIKLIRSTTVGQIQIATTIQVLP